MKFKPPGKRGIIRGLAVSGVTIASVTSLVITQTPAFADPTVTYVAVGSDTIQDIDNGFASAEGSNLLGSYNATNPVTQGIHEVITPAKTGSVPAASGGPTNQLPGESCSFNRPNGSGDGVTALRGSLSGTTSAAGTISTASPITGEAITIGTATGNLPNNLPGTNCVDIARSSSALATANQDPNNGYLLYIPFALDAVTASIGPSAAIAPTTTNTNNVNLPVGCTVGGTTNPCITIPQSNLSALAGVGFSQASLTAMYNSGNDGVANGTATSGVCYAPFGGGAPDAAPTGFTCTSTVSVDLYAPQPNSGTLKFWAAQTGNWSATSPPKWVNQTIVAGPNNATPAQFVGQTVEEHDGTAVSVDPNGIAPLSVAQFIAQNNGIDPRYHGAALTPVNGIAPTTGSGIGQLNTAFPITRNVFNVVAYDRVVNTGDGNYDSVLAQLFVTTSSGAANLCNNRILIQHYGFGLLNSAPLGQTCGEVDTAADRGYSSSSGF